MINTRCKRNQRIKSSRKKKIVALILGGAMILNNLLPIIPAYASNGIQGSELQSLGDYSTYNAVVFGNHTASGADVEGQLAVQGNLTAPTETNNYSIGAAYEGNSVAVGEQIRDTSTPTLLLGGEVNSLSGKITLDSGTGVVGSKANKDNIKPGMKYNGLIQVSDDEIYKKFEEIKEYINKIESDASKYSASEKEIPGADYKVVESNENPRVLINSGESRTAKTLTITGSSWCTYLPNLDDKDLYIFYSEAEEVLFQKDFYYLGKDGNRDNATQVSSRNLEQLQIASKIIWVFPNAKKVTTFKTDVIGTIICPNAELNLHGAAINGQVYTKDLNQVEKTIGGETGKNGEVHNFRFNWFKWNELHPIVDEVKGSIELSKVSSEENNSNLLGGAKFDLYEKDGSGTYIKIGEYETVANKKLFIDNLSEGEYRLVETKAPEGYELDDTPIEFKIEAGKNYPLSLEHKNNKILYGSVELIKRGAETNSLLEGAQFDLYKKENDEWKKFNTEAYITNKDGKVKIDNLLEGTYKFVETKAPEGYINNILVEKEFTITTPQNQIEIVNIYNNAKSEALKGNVELIKVDKETSAALAGAKFELYKVDIIDGKEVYTKKELVDNITNDEGKLVIENLEIGKYFFKEVEAPDGYELDDTPQYFEVLFNSTEVVKVEVTNKVKDSAKLGNVKLIKTGYKGNLLTGVVFELYKDNGEIDKNKWTKYNEYTTDTNGEILISGLPIGKYYFKEKVALPGYEISDKLYEFEITFNQQEVKEIEVANKALDSAIKGMSRIIKKDKDTNNVLQGAKFTLLDSSKKPLVNPATNSPYELISNDDGIVETPMLEIGTYYLKEIKAPQGYELSDEELKIEIVFNGESVIEKEYFNKMTFDASHGDAKLIKTGYNSVALEGAKFVLYKADGTAVNTYVTDKNGEIIMKDLEIGDYYLVEVEAPAGYELDKTPIDIKIEANQVDTKVYYKENVAKDTSLKGNVKLVKTGYQGKLLSGAKFELFKDKKLIGTYTTNEQGEILVENLGLGNYHFIEVEAPNGYIMSADPINFEVKFNSTDVVPTQTINVKNEIDVNLIKGGVKLTKVGYNNETLEGVLFGLYTKSGDLINEYYTDENGQIIIQDLSVGEYYLQEITPLPGYELSSEKFSFEIDFEGQKSFEFEAVNKAKDEALIGGFKLIKTGNFGVLKDAKFKLVKVDNEKETEIATYITNSQGIIEVNNLELGDYYIQEVEAPSGYELDNTKHEFTIEFNQQNLIEINVINEAKEIAIKGNVRLVKTGFKDALLKGAEFELYKEGNLEKLGTYVTDTNGEINIQGLGLGNYYFVETKAPEGYILSNEKYNFTIEFNTTDSVVTKEVKVTNKVDESMIRGGVKLTKKGYENKLLQDVKFGLYLEDGTLVNEYKTNEKGIIEITNLGIGKYYLKEIQALPGYILSDKKYNFEVDFENQTVVEFEAVNKAKDEALMGMARITKKDKDTNNVLQGAKFTLLDSSKKTLVNPVTNSPYELISNADGIVETPMLEIGTYYLKETKAPQGYELSDEELKIEIVFNGESVIEKEYLNVKEKVVEPEVGSVVLTKKDEDNGHVLPGAQFKLYKSNGEEVHENQILVTDINGELSVEYLEVGDYYFEEIKAPEGYVLPEPKLRIEFTIEKDQIKQTVATNKRISQFDPASVILRKLDSETKETLVGAKFNLLDSNNNVIETYETNENGVIYIERIRPGKYSFVEIEAPEGYELDSTPIEFEVKDEDTEIIELSFENKKSTLEEPDNDKPDDDKTDHDKPDNEEEQPDGNDSETTKPNQDALKPEESYNSDKLPQTGESPLKSSLLIGYLMVIAGVIIRKKNN